MLLLHVSCFILGFFGSILCYEIKDSSKVHDANYYFSVNRWAVVVTIAGTKKLSEYFEWSCRSIGNSEKILDMLVFHEGNAKLKEISCAKNVKFIDLGENGLSRLIISEILRSSNSSTEIQGQLSMLLSDIIIHIPRYLVEIKPLTGILFQKWLSEYSHWTYTDPDIIWGNLTKWINFEDAMNYDIITIAKNYDAARLFIRGQFALHKNIQKLNTIWTSLDYFLPQNVAKRLGSAVRMLREQKPSDYIFESNFNSAEGWYSAAVFDSGATVKILGRGFDDFSRDPVLVQSGVLMRCKLEDLSAGMTLLSRTSSALDTDPTKVEDDFTDVYSLPPLQVVTRPATAHPSACRMQWLPLSLRVCIAKEVYSKGSVERQQRPDMQLERLGEVFTSSAVLEAGQTGASSRRWGANDEKLARRQFTASGAFFHFRHWDDYASTGIATEWGADEASCMVLYLRDDKKMAYVPCEQALNRAARKTGAVERPRSDAATKRKQPKKDRKQDGSGLIDITSATSEKSRGDNLAKRQQPKRVRPSKKQTSVA